MDEEDEVVVSAGLKLCDRQAREEAEDRSTEVDVGSEQVCVGVSYRRQSNVV
jgi:hypothetical protein